MNTNTNSVNKSIKATHTGVLTIGDAKLMCYVLEDGRRMVAFKDIRESLGLPEIGHKHMGKTADSTHKTPTKPAENNHLAKTPSFIAYTPLKPFISASLQKILANPIAVSATRAMGGGSRNFCIPAEDFTKILFVWQKAASAGVLSTANQKQAAINACTMIEAFATVGITALVDEATGYQSIRAKSALEQILNRYLRTEYSAWAKRFPDEFYEHIFRLKGWGEFLGNNKPQCLGNYTNDLVYARLAPMVLVTLKERAEEGVRYHQYLTDEIGVPELKEHLGKVIMIMRASESWYSFNSMLDKMLPKQNDPSITMKEC